MILDEQNDLTAFNIVTTLQYFTIPVIYLYKFTVIAFVLWVGSFLFGYRLTYAQLFGLVIIAETLFLIPEILKIGWFLFVKTDYNYYDVKSFYPLSVMNFFDRTLVEPKYHYPFKALNVFELAYWFFLVYLVHWKAKKKLSVAYGIVYSSYVLFFLIWLWFYSTVYK